MVPRWGWGTTINVVVLRPHRGRFFHGRQLATTFDAAAQIEREVSQKRPAGKGYEYEQGVKQ